MVLPLPLRTDHWLRFWRRGLFRCFSACNTFVFGWKEESSAERVDADDDGSCLGVGAVRLRVPSTPLPMGISVAPTFLFGLGEGAIRLRSGVGGLVEFRCLFRWSACAPGCPGEEGISESSCKTSTLIMLRSEVLLRQAYDFIQELEKEIPCAQQTGKRISEGFFFLSRVDRACGLTIQREGWCVARYLKMLPFLANINAF